MSFYLLVQDEFFLLVEAVLMIMCCSPLNSARYCVYSLLKLCLIISCIHNHKIILKIDILRDQSEIEKHMRPLLFSSFEA